MKYVCKTSITRMYMCVKVKDMENKKEFLANMALPDPTRFGPGVQQDKAQKKASKKVSHHL